MRRFLATLMALIMLMSVIPVSAEGTKTGSTGVKLLSATYTQPISKVKTLVAGYAVLLRDAQICSDQQLEEPAGEADKGDVVLAESRKGYGTSSDRVKVTWACKGEKRTGWVAAKHLRLMDKSEVKTYEGKAKQDKKVVKTGGKYLLNIPSYKAPVEEETSRATMPATSISSMNTTSKGLSVKWKRMDGAVRYEVYRSTKKSSGFKRLAKVTTNSYVDATAERNKGYYYYIKTVYEGDEISKSEVKGRYNEYGPSLKFSRSSGGTVTISWGSKKNAVSYGLYRADEGSTSYTKITTVKSGTSYVDKTAANGKTYSYYVVTNYKVSGVSMTGSKGTAKSYTFGVTKPKNLAVANISTGAKITWDAVANATGYRVFYRANESDDWTQVTTTKASAVSYTHKTPAYGQKIQYSVRTQGKLNGKTVYASHSILDHVAVGMTTASIESPMENEVLVTWTSSKGATGYEITLTGEDGSKEYADISAEDDCLVFFMVQDAGTYSAVVKPYCELEGKRWYGRTSNAVSTAVEALDPNKIPVMTATLSSTPNMLNVSWQPVANATGYIVEIQGEGWGQMKECDANATSVSVAVNEGEISVYMCAIFGDEYGRYCAEQTFNADWADGVRLTVPEVTVTQAAQYNRAQLTWEPVTGATTYQIMVLQGEWGEFPGPDGNGATVNLNGNGTYEILVRAETLLSNGHVLVGPWYSAEHTFTWSEDAKKIPLPTVELSATPNYINVSWEAIQGAESYRLQVYGENNGWLVTEETTTPSAMIAVNGGETVKVAVCSVTRNQASGYSDFVSIETYWSDMVAMTKPNVTWSLGSKPHATIEWSESEGATRYHLLVTAEGTGAGEYETTETGYDLDLTPEVAYQFNVVPVYSDGNGMTFPGPRSAFVNCFPVWSEATVPAMYAGCATDANVILVSWDPLAEACIYEIEMIGSDDSVHAWEGEGNAAALAVNGGVTYTLRMRAMLMDGTYGEWCETQTVEAIWDEMVVLAAPEVTLTLGEKVDDENGKVIASWPAVPGAEFYYLSLDGSAYKQRIDTTSVELDVAIGDTLSVAVWAAASTRAGIFNGLPDGATIECVWEADPTVKPDNVKADMSVPNYVTYSWDACYGAVGYQYQHGYSISTVETNEPLTFWIVDTGEERTFKVRAIYEVDGSKVYSDYVTITYKPEWGEEAICLPEPQFTVTLSEDPNYLEISWEEIPDATYYQVSADGWALDNSDMLSMYSVSKLKGTSTKLWVNAGEKYSVRVTAYYETADRFAYNESDTQWITAQWDNAITLGAPVVTGTAEVPNYIELSWDAVPGATGYYVNAEAVGYSYMEMMEVTGTSLSLKVPYNCDYLFCVYAFQGEKANHGPWSEWITVSPDWAEDEAIHLDYPQVKMDTSVPNAITAKWDAVAGAEGYIVQIGVNDYTGANVYRTVRTTDTSISEMVNGDGATYTISVAAYAKHPTTGEEICSSFGGNMATATWADGVNLAKPEVSIFANAYNEELGLVETFVSWKPVEGAAGYRLYHGLEGEEQQVTDLGAEEGQAFELAKGKKYTFRAEAYFYMGTTQVTGPASDEVSFTALYGSDLLSAPEVQLSIDQDGYILVSWEQVEHAFSYTITYNQVGQTPVEEYLEAFTGEDWDIPVTSWRFLPEPGAQYEVAMCANWEEDGGLDHGPSSDKKLIDAVLATPELLLQQAETPNYMILDWADVPHADKYRVEIKSGAEDTRIFEVGAAESAMTVPVSNNEECLVEVYAIGEFADGHSLTSHDSDSLRPSWIDGVTLTAPVNVTLSNGLQGGVNVEWPAVAGAEGYLITPSTDTWTGDALDIKSVEGASNYAAQLLDIPESEWGKTLTVTVKAYLGGSSAYGPVTSAASEEATFELSFTATPEITLQASETPYEVIVSWMPGADLDADDYEVRVYEPEQDLYPEGGAMLSDAITMVEGKCVVTFKARSGYDYRVEVWASAQGAHFSDVEDITPVWNQADMPKPNAQLEANDDNQLILSWEPMAGAVSYDVFYREPGATRFGRRRNATSPFVMDNNGGETMEMYVQAMYGSVPAWNADAQDWSNSFVMEGGACDILSATANGIVLTEPVMTLSAITPGRIDVSWEPVAGATTYFVFFEIGGEMDYYEMDADGTSAYITIPEANWGQDVTVWMGAAVMESYLSFAGPECDHQTIKAEWNIELVAPEMTVSTEDCGWLTISWEPVAGANRYRIFYKKTTASGYTNLYADGAETSVKIPAANSTSYTVYMRAMNVSAITGVTTSGPNCTSQKVSTAWTTRLAAPELTIAKGAKGVLNLSWTAVAGAEGYVLNYKKSTETAYTQMFLAADELACELEVTQEETYDLYIQAFDGDASEPYLGKKNAAESYFATWIPVLVEPVMELRQGSIYRLEVSWEPVEFATSYRLYYKEVSASGYNSVKLEASATSYSIRVENDATYTVYMRAVHEDEDGTTTSGPKCSNQNVYVSWEEPQVPTPTLTITPISGDDVSTELEVAWTVPDTACGYILYYRPQGAAEFGSMDVTDKAIPMEIFNTDTGIVWEFYMQAYYVVDEEEFWGEPTSIVTVTAAYGFHSLVAPVMELMSGNEPNELIVSWEQQAFATSYAVYYKTSDATTYAREGVPGDGSSLALTVEAEKTYEVYMTACFEENGVTEEGPACEVESIYTYWAPVLPVPEVQIQNDFNGKVTVEWRNIGDANVAEVRYRKTTQTEYDYEGVDLELLPDTAGLFLELEPLTDYEIYVVTYHYHNDKIYAQNASNKVTITTLGEPTIAAPEMMLALGERGYINVSWNPVANANGYAIYYKAIDESSYTSVKVGGDVTEYAVPVEVFKTYTVYVRGIYVDPVLNKTTSGTKCSNQTIEADWTVYRALLIGQTYPEAEKPLPGPDVDAKAVRTMLATMSGTPYLSTVKLNLTADGIRSAIASTFAGADEDSVSLFYYSGHGANSGGGSGHGALCGTNSTYLSVSELRAALDKIPGTKIVLLDSCHSGAHIGKSVDGMQAVSKADMAAFNNSVIMAFAAKTKSDLATDTNLATDRYYVITASHSQETSLSMGNAYKYVGAFTHGLLYGCGYDEWNEKKLASMDADTDADKQITLHEAYTYAYNAVLNGVGILEDYPAEDQHVQVYPVNSSYVLWGK